MTRQEEWMLLAKLPTLSDHLKAHAAYIAEHYKNLHGAAKASHERAMKRRRRLYAEHVKAHQRLMSKHD